MNRLAESVVAAPTRGPWVAAGVALCGCAAVVIVDPQQNAMSPPCPFRALTGWWCPFCGATRATAALLAGDLGRAFRYNALWLITIPFLVIGWVAWAFGGSRISELSDALRGRVGESWLGKSPTALVGTAAVLAAFVLIRNVGVGIELFRFPGA